MSKTTLYIFLALTSAALYALTHFTINSSSPSEPTGLYRPTHEPLKRGALVLLKMPLKTIAALPGDQVDMTPTGIEINGKPQPNTTPAPNLPHCPFGSFVVRKKGQRIVRNPKTGREVPISPRRVMVFKPSAILKQRINSLAEGKLST